jgi:putative ABC transport system permease protein
MTWWGRLFSRRRLERELDAELRDHFERQVADYRAQGVPEPDARRRARLALGGDDHIKEECRDARGTRWVENAFHDLRYGVRILAKAPVFTGMAVLSLALGIGANTAIFSIVNGVLLRTLPVREPERLVLLKGGSWTNPIWEQIRARQWTLFDGAIAWGEDRFDLAAGGPSQPAEGLWVSGGFFDVLGVPFVAGRTFLPEDDRRGGGPNGPVAVISHRFWQRHFGGARDVIGRSLSLNRVSFTIIGVTSPAFAGPVTGRAFDIAVPLGSEPLVRGKESFLDARSTWWLDIMGRLKPGATIGDAALALRAVQPQIRQATLPEDWPASELKNYLSGRFELVSGSAGAPQFRDQYRQSLLILMATVGLVLLIACANIANLMLARANARRHELSLRRAMGASGPRLARQLLTESLLLAGAGAILGLAFAVWGSRLLVGQLTTFRETVFVDVSLDWRALAFTVVVTVGTALLFGLAPALRASRVDPGEAMKDQGRTITGERHRMLGQPLVILQVALSLVLLVGAGLFIRTFVTLTHQNFGFDPDRLLILDVDVQRTGVLPEDRPALYTKIEAAVRRVPGVANAAISMIRPVSGMGWNNMVEVPGGRAMAGRDKSVWLNGVSPQWFATYRVPLIAGRGFAETDRSGAPSVAIVNRAFATKFVGAANPIGRVVRRVGMRQLGKSEPDLEIIGLVETTPYNELRESAPPIVYMPLAQAEATWPSQTLAVRASLSNPASLTRSLADVVASIDRNVSLTFLPLTEQIDSMVVRERVLALLSGFFGALALLLAGIGLYGVTSYSVSRRRMEIGVRMALGADAAAVVRLVMARLTLLLSVGLAIGAVASLWASTFVRTLLYGLEPNDPATLVAATLVLSIVAALAAWLPARRAARIDPAQVLREG